MITYSLGGTQPPLGLPSIPLSVASLVHLHLSSSTSLARPHTGAGFWLVSEGMSSRTAARGPAWACLSRLGASVPLTQTPSTLKRKFSLHLKSVPGQNSSQSSHLLLTTSPLGFSSVAHQAGNQEELRLE